MIAKLHTYAGLLTFVNLMVFGIVGLSSAFGPKTANAWQVREIPLRLEPGMPDRAVAERVCAALGLTLATPIQSAVIQHDGAGNLLLDFWHANGRHRVTVLRAQGTIRVETRRNSLWSYLDTLHTTTAVFRTGDWRMRLWAWYNEFAMWSLLAMLASGVWMWLSSNPRHRWAQVSLGLGCAACAALYFCGR
jgi:hypothetical protein